MRPLRNSVEGVTSKIPSGPKGFFGGGNFLGYAGFGVNTAVNTISPFSIGYDIKRSSIVESDDEGSTHRVYVWAMSRNVAEIAARKSAAGGSQGMLADNTDIQSVKKVDDRKLHSLWRVEVRSDMVMELD